MKTFCWILWMLSALSQRIRANEVRRISFNCSVVNADGVKKFSYQNRSPRRVCKKSLSTKYRNLEISNIYFPSSEEMMNLIEEYLMS